MSFPPRAPMGIATYGFPPAVSMVPLPMGVMPPGGRPMMNTKIPPRAPNRPGEKGPVTTVFVGNICERAPDSMVKQMLQRCGNVLSWKRVQGASGKIQAFGFCEYDRPESTLRCIRLLNDWLIVDKRLVVKVDGKTQDLLDEHRAKKRAEKKKESSEGHSNGQENKEEGETDDEAVDEATMREDRVAKAGLDAIQREHNTELMKEPLVEKKEKRIQRNDKDEGIDDLEMEEEKKDLISREIRIFRDMHKNDERQEEIKPSAESREMRERERERRRRLDRERDAERDRERREREREEERRRRERERSRSKERSKDRERREKKVEEEEEMYERKKLERRLRDKETAYQERLKAWEARERKRAREHEKEKEKDEEKKSEESKEGRRLKEFLEDYDDDRDDPKFYKGSALIRRLKEREKEIEADNRDRQREKEEIEEIRRQMLDEGHPNPEAVLAKLEEERKEHLRPRLKLEEPVIEPVAPPVVDVQPPPRSPSPAAAPINDRLNGSRHESSGDDDAEGCDSGGGGDDGYADTEETSLRIAEPAPLVHRDDTSQSAADSPAEQANKRKKHTVSEVFNQDDEESGSKRRKLSLPVEEVEPEKPKSKIPQTAEEKKQFIKNLIESIPTTKEELFAFTLEWEMVDTALMNKRIKPWVNKKIIEYIGEEELTLTDFICQKVMAHSIPQNLLNDVAMVLDDEAEVFVVKMWRLLIYETEAKKAGLTK